MKKESKSKINKNPTIGNVLESIDSLAISVKRGFDEVYEFRDEMYEFRDEMYEFRDEMYGFKNKTEASLFSLDSHARQTNERLDAIEKTLGPLVQVSSVMQKEIRSLNMRVDRLEKMISSK